MRYEIVQPFDFVDFQFRVGSLFSSYPVGYHPRLFKLDPFRVSKGQKSDPEISGWTWITPVKPEVLKYTQFGTQKRVQMCS